MFGIKIGLYRPGLGSSFYATDSDPSLPVNFAELTMGILGLDNYTTVKPAESPCSGPFCPQGILVGYSISSLLTGGKDGTGQKVAIVDVPGTPIDKAVYCMAKHGIRRLPVIDREELVGLVSEHDLLRWMLQVSYEPHVPIEIKQILARRAEAKT